MTRVNETPGGDIGQPSPLHKARTATQERVVIEKLSTTGGWGGWTRSAGWVAIAMVAGLWVVTATTKAKAAPEAAPATTAGRLASTAIAPNLIAQGQSSETSTPAPAVSDPKTKYGLWTILPALVAIVLAIITRQVIPSLVIGIVIGAFMMVPCLAAGEPLAGSNSLVTGVRLAAEKYVFGALSDSDHLRIIFFTLLIGFTVGVIAVNGGTTGMVRLIAGNTQSRRRGALTAWLAGLVVFFDDYANTMIVGPTMRSVFDRLKISRAKLAYIVDSTAAPVASIALIGTWVGTEVSYIDLGLKGLAGGEVPAFLLDSDGQTIAAMSTFVQSIAYRFYPILAVFLVFLVALTGRDFGPMRRSERKVLSQIDGDPLDTLLDPSSPKPRWWLGFVPILVLVAMTVAVLVATGMTHADTVTRISAIDSTGASLWGQTAWWEKGAHVFGNARPYLSIFYGSIFAAVVAIVLTIAARACSIKDAFDGGLDGMTKVYPAVVILVLAWALSGVLRELQLGEVVAAKLNAAQFDPKWLPLAVFAAAAMISFATGTSYGTMGILCPMTVDIGARIMVDLPQADALPLFYASIGSVLAGAVFGDHCSPISDTTVLSSLACGCRHEEHVWTQIPYALLTAVAAMVLGDVMCSVYGQPWYYGLAAGAVFLTLWIFAFGRQPVPSFELADA